jgi:hypothetical protein
MIGRKYCSRCGLLKPLSDFSLDRSRSDGRQNTCKDCYKKYRRENIEHIKVTERKYRESHRDERREKDKQYYRENIERKKEYDTKYRETNTDKRRDQAREWREVNRERVSEKSHQYYKNNGCEIRERSRKYKKCLKNLNCQAIGGRGAEFIIFSCEACGKEFRRLKKAVDWDYEHYGRLPRFCSKECRNYANRKDYTSPYARKINRIKREVGQ